MKRVRSIGRLSLLAASLCLLGLAFCGCQKGETKVENEDPTKLGAGTPATPGGGVEGAPAAGGGSRPEPPATSGN